MFSETVSSLLQQIKNLHIVYIFLKLNLVDYTHKYGTILRTMVRIILRCCKSKRSINCLCFIVLQCNIRMEK